MADQYTPEEIAEIFEAYNNAIKTNTPISAELAKQMQDATKGFRGATDALNKFGKALGTSALDLGKSLYKGEKGVGQFGDAVESAAGALSLLEKALGPLSLVARGLIIATQLLAKGFNAAAKQGDALYKSYQDLSRAGATASDGISGVFRNMQNLGYGIEELDKMVALVTQNSETLAKFSLTAADGTNAFAQGMAQIQRDGSLRVLGKTTDDINSAGAAFIRQSVRAGISQKDIGDKLGAQTKAYVLELDRLQRLTGMSADALQKQQDEAMAEDAYNDVMSELKQRAAGGDEVAKMQIEKITTVMNKLGPEMRKEFVAGIGGDVSAQQRLFMAAPNLMKDTMDETANTQKTINNLNRDAANTVGTFGKSARLAAGAYRDTFGPLYEMRETMVATADFDARTDAAKKNAEVIDGNTKRLTEAQIANMNSRDAMQAFIQKGVAPATVALNALAQGASKLAGGAAAAVGAPTGGAAAGATPVGGGGAAGPSGSYIDRIDKKAGGGASLGNLRIKSPEAYSGGETSQQLITVAQAIQEKLGGDLHHFSAFNDSYHRGPNSLHGKGRALDFTLTDPKKAAAVADMVRSIPGISKVIDEYAKPSGHATAPHIHAEISAANGAILSGPTSGYKPNLTMHGTEAIVPLNSPAAQSAFGGSDQTSLMSAQLDKLDELVRVMQNQVSVSTKILQAAN
jgi:hypothetical protein